MVFQAVRPVFGDLLEGVAEFLIGKSVPFGEEVPDGVRDVLHRRLARLPPLAVSVLRVAAVAGLEAEVDLVVRAAEVDESDVLDALEAGVIAGLLSEPAPGTVRFVHGLVRHLVRRGSEASGTLYLSALLSGPSRSFHLAHQIALLGQCTGCARNFTLQLAVVRNPAFIERP